MPPQRRRQGDKHQREQHVVHHVEEVQIDQPQQPVAVQQRQPAGYAFRRRLAGAEEPYLHPQIAPEDDRRQQRRHPTHPV
jgi:hypothetical protein